jgi:flagellar basal-body rod protein FlgF/flagellar basal-body rod protein FlgG
VRARALVRRLHFLELEKTKMDSGYYAAFTGLASRMQALDVVANNLANVNTMGFRGQYEFYESVSAGIGNQLLSPLNVATNNYGVLGGADIDLDQGNFEATGNPLDLAIKGSAFFAIQTPRGVRYTRNGSFHVNAAGQIVNEDGDTVLGPDGSAVQVPQGQITVAQDGSVTVAGAVSGNLRLVEFAPGTDLLPEGATNFVAPEGAAHDATASTVAEGMLESANVSPVKETVELIALQRHSEMLERTLSIFLDDFNRTAATDLARD